MSVCGKQISIIKQVCFLGLMFICSGLVFAGYKGDIGFTRLTSEYGSNLPVTNSMLATHVEARDATTNDYMPDVTDARFVGKTFVDKTGDQLGTYSVHATGVGSRFYGIYSISSNVNTIDVYEANDWLQGGFLNFGSNSQPQISASRIANHSWIGDTGNDSYNLDLLTRIDWLIETDEFIQLVGTRNNNSLPNQPLFSSAFNVINVANTAANHSQDSVGIVGSDYTSSRTRPDIVAPFLYSSASTPVIASSTALLMNVGHSPALSTDPVVQSTTNRSGAVIYNAERSETIKAILLAGADRYTKNREADGSISLENIIDYRIDSANQKVNGMDKRFGAGQVNIYNSYLIMTAGEQNSVEDGGTGSTGIANSGFDYDPNFGGANSSNSIASYNFTTGADSVIFTAALVWNIDIDGGSSRNYSGASVLYDLDLYLYDLNNGQLLLKSSTSSIDNTENIRVSLLPNRDYLLQVVPKSGQVSFDWDYALAWLQVPDPDSDLIPDFLDNCALVSNPGQADLDTDNIGDLCDTDIDGDGVDNTLDAFPYDPAETTDTDGDGIGNNADTDDDNDGLSDVFEISIGTDTLSVDSDGDGLTDYAEVAYDGDVATYTPGSDLNPLSTDTDQDGIADNADPIPLNYNYADGDVGPLGAPDGLVNQADLVIMNRILTGQLTATVSELSHADLYPQGAPDGVIDLSDMVLFQKLILQ